MPINSPASRLMTIPRTLLPLLCGLARSVGERIADDGNDYQCDAAEEQESIALRRDQIAAECADNQRDTDTYRKRDRHAGNFDCCYEKQVCDVEDRSAANSEENGHAGSV